MKSLVDYYIKSLYPFQDGVLNIVKKSGLPFYLTGGTALSRGYFNHRFSDDLDFFVNNAADYPELIVNFIEALEHSASFDPYKIDKKSIRRSHSFTQIFINSNDNKTTLKIDLVNDIAYHVGATVKHPHLGRMDNWKNILSNKLAALYRYEPKDIADIWCIAKNKRFSWKSAINDAKEKDGGIDPLAVVEILTTVPPLKLDSVKWIVKPNLKYVISDLKQIGNAILTGTVNNPEMLGEGSNSRYRKKQRY